MKSHIDLRFRPSLLIFVDDTGKRIREQLTDIMRFAGLDPVLRQSIAFLQVAAGSDRAKRVALPEGASSVEQEDTLERLVEATCRDVQANKRVLEIIDSGYPVPNPRTQIYIVGDASSPWLAKVLQVVQQRLEKQDFHTLVCYVLSAYRVRQVTGALDKNRRTRGQESIVSQPVERWSANFCYLYEDMLTYPMPTFLDEPESNYAAAEALFTLITSGLTTEPFFEDPMKLTMMYDSYKNIGSLSTSMIVFPRSYVLEYCSARLGVALTNQWSSDIRAIPVPDTLSQQLQKHARQVAKTIGMWIAAKPLLDFGRQPAARKDAWSYAIEARPNLGRPTREGAAPGIEPFSPYNAQEQKTRLNSDRGLYRRIQEETRTLFELFSLDDVNSEYSRSRSRFDSWTKLVYHRASQAVDAYKDWDKAATDAWETIGKRIREDCKNIVDQLWSGDEESGFEQAMIFVDELDDRLAKIADLLSRWREDHHHDYQGFLATFERLADGPWVLPEETSNVVNSNMANGQAAQAGPTMGGQLTNAGASTAPGDNTILGGAPQGGLPHQHLPQREENVAQRLEQRILWFQNQVPALPTQAVAAVPFIFVLVLAALAGLSRTLPPTPPVIGIITVVIAGIVGLANLWFRKKRLQRVEEAKIDLLAFYSGYYSHRCDEREDRLRAAMIMGPLRRSVQSMRERLDTIQIFIAETAAHLDERAKNVKEKLFESPASMRDIFVANGERLQKEKKNTLEDFVGQITKLRNKQPVETWHRSPQDLKRELIAMFRKQPQSLMEVSYEQAREQIYEFAAEVIQPYFKGPLVDIQYALDKQDVWAEALKRVEHPLYHIREGMQKPLYLFVCGREADIRKAAPYVADARPVYLSDAHEWVLFAAFFLGGSPDTFDADILFPDKSTPQVAATPPDDDTTTAAGTASKIEDDDLWETPTTASEEGI